MDAAVRLAELIRGAERAVVLTGAGVSVPSGIPDFRTPGKGMWEKVNPMEVAHIDAFRSSPDRFWQFYSDRFASLVDKRPNPAHEAIGSFEALRHGLVNQVVPDHELFDTALAWARKLSEKAPIAIEQIKSVSAMGELGEGLEAEAHGFARAFGSEDAKEGISAFLGKRQAKFQGK